MCIIAGCFVKDSKSLFTAGGGLYISAGKHERIAWAFEWSKVAFDKHEHKKSDGFSLNLYSRRTKRQSLQ